MAKRLEETEAASSIAMKNLSKKQKIIQDQAKLIKEKEKESSAEGGNAKDKEKQRAHAEMKQRMEESEALSTKAMNELIEKEKKFKSQQRKYEKKSRRVVVMH